MVEPERRHRAGPGGDHVGRVEPAAEPHLDHHHVHAAKGGEGHQRDDLEEGQPRVAERPGNLRAHLFQELAGAFLGDGLAADADALAEVAQVRRV